jgi:hypothetical protein
MCKLRSGLFRRLQLEKAQIFSAAQNLQKERRDAFSGRGGRCQNFSISNRLEIDILASRLKSHLDHFRSSSSHALMQVMRDLAGQRLRHTLGAANCIFISSKRVFCIHQNKHFHTTRPLGRLSPVGRICLFNHRKEVDS